MSYDLYLPRGSDEDPDAAYEQLENDAGLPDPVKEERKQRLAETLLSLHPAVALSERDYAAIASEEGISEQEARWENREAELVAPGIAGQTVEVDLFDDDARVRLESLQRVGDEQALSLAWLFLNALVAERGFVPYDPQLGRALDLEHDFERVLRGTDRSSTRRLGLRAQSRSN